MLKGLMHHMMNFLVDDITRNLLTEKYGENLMVMGTAMEKLTLRDIVEAGMRAETGNILERPLGSPNIQSPWETMFLNPTQLFSLPAKDTTPPKIEITIGKNAKKPLKLSMPIMITGMSYGASISLKAKLAFAKGATLAGTATNTGESALTKEEREAAHILIGQYHRGGWMNTKEQLSQLDAIEVQFGQGSWGGGVPYTVSADKIGEHLRQTWGLGEGEDGKIHSRLPGVDSPEDIVKLLNKLKKEYDVPVGVKIAATHHIEKELDIILRTNIDYIAIDGSPGGTAGAPPTLEDHVGLPTLYALSRAVGYLESKGVKDQYDIIISGGMKTPGHFLKALALGATAVYIGSIAIMAMLQTQITKSMPSEPAPQLILYDGRLADELDVDKGATALFNFLTSCREEMKLVLIALGKTDISQLTPNDLVTVDKQLAETLGIGFAGRPNI